MDKIILASQSPRRRQLLEWAEIAYEAKAPNISEEFPQGLSTDEIPVWVARQKMLATRKKVPENVIILAADTLVFLDDQVIGKPVSRHDAIGMLTRMSGRMHLVVTGVVLADKQREVSFSDTTEVWFHALSSTQIEYYVDKYHPMDKAGAYAIQEWIGVIGIEKIRGDFYNVMGLPVSRVVRTLASWRA